MKKTSDEFVAEFAPHDGVLFGTFRKAGEPDLRLMLTLRNPVTGGGDWEVIPTEGAPPSTFLIEVAAEPGT